MNENRSTNIFFRWFCQTSIWTKKCSIISMNFIDQWKRMCWCCGTKRFPIEIKRQTEEENDEEKTFSTSNQFHFEIYQCETWNERDFSHGRRSIWIFLIRDRTNKSLSITKVNVSISSNNYYDVNKGLCRNSVLIFRNRTVIIPVSPGSVAKRRHL